MNSIDVNCLIGHWPFRKIRKNSFNDLKKVHEANGISSGFVASLNSIFYNDPFEGDEELHEIIKDSSYHHVLTVNPTLPCFDKDIEKGIEEFNIKGVRIYPGYHGYNLNDKNVLDLCDILVKKNLPLFLTMRMEDIRLNYLLQPRKIEVDEVRGLIALKPDLKIVILNILISDISSLEDCIKSNKNVFFDASGFKDGLFNVEKLVERFTASKIIYGSLHPMNCLKSTLIQVELAKLNVSDKEMILYKNANNLL